VTPACPAPSPTSGNATIASRAATSTRTIVTPVDGACVASHVTVTSRSQADDRMSSQPTWARLEAVFAVQHVIAQFGSAVHSRRGPQRLPSGRRSAGFRQSRVGPRGRGVVPIVRCMSDCCVAPNQASAERSPCASSPTTLAVCNSLAAENACAPTRRAAAPSRMARGRRARTGQLCVESTTASGPGGYAPAVSRGRPWTVH
jgi:hypothetical protein